MAISSFENHSENQRRKKAKNKRKKTKRKIYSFQRICFGMPIVALLWYVMQVKTELVCLSCILFVQRSLLWLSGCCRMHVAAHDTTETVRIHTTVILLVWCPFLGGSFLAMNIRHACVVELCTLHNEPLRYHQTPYEKKRSNILKHIHSIATCWFIVSITERRVCILILADQCQCMRNNTSTAWKSIVIFRRPVLFPSSNPNYDAVCATRYITLTIVARFNRGNNSDRVQCIVPKNRVIYI